MPPRPPILARDLTGFFALSHGWTWAFWAAAGLSGTSVWTWPAVALFVIGGAGVLLGGVVMTRVILGPSGLRDLARRVVDGRRIRRGWWAVVLLLYPALTVLAASVAPMLGGTTPALDLAGAAHRLANPVGLLAWMSFILIIGPLPEEIGWRGYLLDRVQARWSALAASLFIAATWWVWHLPLFVLPGYYDAFGREVPSPLHLLGGLVPAAILYTWVYNNTDRSVFAVVLLHFMQNFTGELLGLADDARPVRLALEALLAVGVVLRWGPGRLRRDARRPHGIRESLRMADDGPAFHADMLGDLPPPARRYLTRAITPGTPLARSITLEMTGSIRLAPDREPLPMRAEQILAPPVGFLWAATVGRGLFRISGFDRYERDEGELRWRLWGLVPLVRARGADVTRSAAARLAMEAVLLPSALVPGRGARWEAVDDRQARFHLTVGVESVVTTLTLDPEGRPLRASAMRWREGTGDRAAGYDRFDVELRGELTADGLTLPRHIEAGWRLGEPDEFRFFVATLQRAIPARAPIGATTPA